jgi:hypothetical protein
MQKDESNIESTKSKICLKSETDHFENVEVNVIDMILCSIEYVLR